MWLWTGKHLAQCRNQCRRVNVIIMRFELNQFKSIHVNGTVKLLRLTSIWGNAIIWLWLSMPLFFRLPEKKNCAFSFWLVYLNSAAHVLCSHKPNFLYIHSPYFSLFFFFFVVSSVHFISDQSKGDVIDRIECVAYKWHQHYYWQSMAKYIQINAWEDTCYNFRTAIWNKPKWLHMLDDDLLQIKILIHF